MHHNLHKQSQPSTSKTGNVSPTKFDLSQFQKRLDNNFKKIESQLSVKKIQKKFLFKAIVEENVEHLTHDPLTKDLFKNLHTQRYKNKFEQYLSLLFNQDTFIYMGDLKRIHSFGIPSQMYTHFKMLLFRTIYHIQNYYVGVQLMFQGCKRVQKMRLCIATLNQMFHVEPKKKLVDQLQFQLDKAGFVAPQNFIQYLLELLFNSTNLGELSDVIALNQTRLSKVWPVIKMFVVRQALTAGLSYMLFTAIQNLRLLKPLINVKNLPCLFIKSKYKMFNVFVAKIINQLKKLSVFIGPNVFKQTRAAQLMIYYLFDTTQICFSRFEVAYIIQDQQLTRQFFDLFFMNLLKVIRKQQFDQDFMANLILDSKRLRRVCLKKTPKEAVINALAALLQKCFNRILMVWGKKYHKLCHAKSMALYFCKQQIFDAEELHQIHSKLNICEHSYNFVKESICTQFRQSEKQKNEKEYFSPALIEGIPLAFERYRSIIMNNK